MFTNRFQAEQGRLLVSEPFLPDPVFHRSVILLTKCDESGAVGFILNKPVNFTLADALSGITGFNTSVFFGGPVSPDALFFMHRLGEKISGSVPVIEGLYWGGEFQDLKKLFENRLVTAADIKFFVGYAGWSPGQLEKEMKKKSWIVSPARPLDILTEKPERLWGAALKNMGSEFSYLANYPDNPSLN